MTDLIGQLNNVKERYLKTPVSKSLGFIQAVFRQHQWYDRREPEWYYDTSQYFVICKRCGYSFPISLKHIDMGWWQGGCPGEKQLLINELKRRKNP